MGEQRFKGRARINGHYVHPFEELCVVGLDSKHRSRAEHIYFDERALLVPDPLQVENVVENGVIVDVLYKPLDCSRDERFPAKWRAMKTVAIIVEGRQRTMWARAATEIRTERGHAEPVVFVPAREIKGSELQIWLRSRSANAVRVAPSPTMLAREMLELRGMGCSDSSIANTYACPTSEVEEYLRLLELSPRVVAGIDGMSITRSAAKLLREMNHAEQDVEIERLEADGIKLTVENVRAAVRSRSKKPASKGGGDESGIKVTLKQIHKMATLAESGEVEIDATAKKVLRILSGKAGPAGVQGMKQLLRAVGIGD